jgi:hypothetical protein
MGTSITIPSQIVPVVRNEVTIPSQNVGVPSPNIIYSNSWLNQTSAISSINILSPSTEGLFRVTAGIFAYGSGSCSAAGELYYPTLGGQQCTSNNNSGNQQNTAISFVVNPASGVPVQLSTSIGGSLSYYDLYITIEQLQ